MSALDNDLNVWDDDLIWNWLYIYSCYIKSRSELHFVFLVYNGWHIFHRSPILPFGFGNLHVHFVPLSHHGCLYNLHKRHMKAVEFGLHVYTNMGRIDTQYFLRKVKLVLFLDASSIWRCFLMSHTFTWEFAFILNTCLLHRSFRTLLLSSESVFLVFCPC